ncbi:MAG: phage Gp37/Gp68 family protein [Bdellovibrionales bacterium]|nr:phage Gp37/Gp68 family protein [Bdellovibrionales bacterium]
MILSKIKHLGHLMATSSSIEWTETTWNPLSGCNKISPGCKNCYAERMSFRLKAMGVKRYKNGFSLTLHEEAIKEPYKWKKPRIVFVNSMSDLFHKDVPVDFIKKVFKAMEENPQHQFQVLTKRAERLEQLANQLPWPPNIWMGVSVENQKYTSRIKHLTKVPAKVRFLSIEPLIGPIKKLPLRGIHWVIVGGESGPGARPIEKEWVRDIRDRCIDRDVPFFFKQWGGVRKHTTGRRLDRRLWNEMPSTSHL